MSLLSLEREEANPDGSELADELVGLKVDVIVAGGAGAVTAAKNASATTTHRDGSR